MILEKIDIDVNKVVLEKIDIEIVKVVLENINIDIKIEIYRYR